MSIILTDPAFVDQCMRSGADLFRRDIRCHPVPVDLGFPHLLARNADRFRHLILSGPECPRIDLLYARTLLQQSDIHQQLPDAAASGANDAEVQQ
jgi:hypothetical protein